MPPSLWEPKEALSLSPSSGQSSWSWGYWGRQAERERRARQLRDAAEEREERWRCREVEEREEATWGCMMPPEMRDRGRAVKRGCWGCRRWEIGGYGVGNACPPQLPNAWSPRESHSRKLEGSPHEEGHCFPRAWESACFTAKMLLIHTYTYIQIHTHKYTFLFHLLSPMSLSLLCPSSLPSASPPKEERKKVQPTSNFC